MSLQPCHQLARDLKTAIDARMMGRQVTQAGRKDRSVSYAEIPLKDLVAYYNQVRASCADAQADPELIELAPLDQPTTRRGRPMIHVGRA